MRIFALSVLATIAIAVASDLVLTRTVGESAEHAFSTTSARP